MKRLLALALLLAAPALAWQGAFDEEEEGAEVVNEEKNFALRTPNDDWDIMPADPDQGVDAYVLTQYALNEGEQAAFGELRVTALGLARSWVRKPLVKFAEEWRDVYEGHLLNTRERKETTGTLGGAESLTIDVTGDWESGEARRTYTFCKHGQHLYVIYIDRTYKAVRDEDLQEELDGILKSFRFIKEADKTKSKRGSKDEAPPVAGGGDSGKRKSGPDPKLLRRKEIDGGFWRVSFVKPKGFLMETVTPEEATRYKLKYKMRLTSKDRGAEVEIRIYADSTKSQQRTIKQWAQVTEKYFLQRYPEHQEPEVDKKFKMPMTKAVIRLLLLGKKGQVVHFEHLFIQGKNDRQYRIQIYSTASAHRTKAKQIDEFRENFELKKK